jgi:prolyl-tRNA editing enzyme YbaK/EbsC (Cys-tRNA(Pro) deacylase)
MIESSKGIERVRLAFSAAGVPCDVKEMPSTTRTAQEAAQAIGCEVAQIAKSLVFRGQASETAILVIASGAHRVDEGKLALLIGEHVERADAAFVRSRSGFAIGGVPPAGHLSKMRTFLDAALLEHSVIWAAAGTPFAVVPLTPDNLQRLTGAEWFELRNRD